MRPHLAILLTLGLLAGLPLPQATEACAELSLFPSPKCSNKSALAFSDGGCDQNAYAVCVAGNQSDDTVNCYSDVEGGVHDRSMPWENEGLQLSDLTDPEYNCGTCGNSCYEQDISTCTAGQCTCELGDYCLDGAGYCDSSTGDCKACPIATMLNCDTDDDTGVAGDCNIDITSNPNYCGNCDYECLPNENCVDGTCVCGSSANGTRCLDPSAPFCIDGKCVACDKDQLTSSDDCWTNTVDREYCAADGSCKSCPAGKADCTNSGDVGTEDDCETDVAVTGTTNNCGSCGAPAGQSDTALTCCAGVPKCGTFANLSAPTTGECAAATQCSTDEYCDSTFKTCIPLGDPLHRNCHGTATYPNDGDYLALFSLSPPTYCFSCNKNETHENLVAGRDLDNGVAFACRSSIEDRNFVFSCGKAQNSSCYREDDAAYCLLGKCVRTEESVDHSLTWAEFDDVNPDPNVAMQYYYDDDIEDSFMIKRASGCSLDKVKGVAAGWANYYSARYIRSFFTCISLYDEPYSWANYSLVTYETFANKSSRDTICNGKEGMCTTEFCDELYTNSTMYSSSFCSAVETTLGEVKRCIRDFRQKPRESFLVNSFYGPRMKTTTIRSEDYDWAYGLRQKCLQSAYGDDSDALIMNTAIFLKCPIIPATITEGARFKIDGSFSQSLGFTEAGPRACVATFSGTRATSTMAMSAVMTVMAATIAIAMGN